MSGVCYAGKNAILKKKQQFYLHNRHLGSIPSACYAGKSDDWKWENPFFTCITDTWHGSYAGKSDIFSIMNSELDLSVFCKDRTTTATTTMTATTTTTTTIEISSIEEHIARTSGVVRFSASPSVCTGWTVSGFAPPRRRRSQSEAPRKIDWIRSNRWIVKFLEHRSTVYLLWKRHDFVEALRDIVEEQWS